MDITDSIHLFANDPYEFALKFKREIYVKNADRMHNRNWP